MNFAVEVSPKTLLFTVFISWVIGFVGMVGGKTLNLRIGFDLTQGKNGGPALRIRDFQGSSELNPRAAVEDERTTEPVIRADSFSESNEKKIKREGSSRSDSVSSDEDDGDRSANNRHDFNDNIRSTKGIRPGEYEPEENARLHGKYEDDDNDSDADARRYKRHANFEGSKRKGKKAYNLRKQISTDLDES